ncbi:uncharacterized protein VTP21DRAFT_304 [Calcarisporiella thermophila]|uniref:uncharacterized protein n=1 Tax=Calcarisporiella thermophila TaxID=911321 RepID=UPI003742C1C4
MNFRTLIVAVILAATVVQGSPYVRRDEECSFETCHGISQLVRKCFPEAVKKQDDREMYKDIFKCFCDDSSFLSSYEQCMNACGKHAKDYPSVQQVDQYCKLGQ